MRILLALALAGTITAAHAYDNGQWGNADPAFRACFAALRSPAGGPCCDYAEGTRVEDPDWGNNPDGSFWVILDNKRQQVAADREVGNRECIKDKINYTIVWIYWEMGKKRVRCILPGTRS